MIQPNKRLSPYLSSQKTRTKRGRTLSRGGYLWYINMDKEKPDQPYNQVGV
jgi:hypothetical protein